LATIIGEGRGHRNNCNLATSISFFYTAFFSIFNRLYIYIYIFLSYKFMFTFFFSCFLFVFFLGRTPAISTCLFYSFFLLSCIYISYAAFSFLVFNSSLFFLSVFLCGEMDFIRSRLAAMELYSIGDDSLLVQ